MDTPGESYDGCPQSVGQTASPSFNIYYLAVPGLSCSTTGSGSLTESNLGPLHTAAQSLKPWTTSEITQVAF